MRRIDSKRNVNFVSLDKRLDNNTNCKNGEFQSIIKKDNLKKKKEDIDNRFVITVQERKDYESLLLQLVNMT